MQIDKIKLDGNGTQGQLKLGSKNTSKNASRNASRSPSQSRDNDQRNINEDLQFKTQIFHINKDFVKVFWTIPFKHILINQYDDIEVIHFLYRK